MSFRSEFGVVMFITISAWKRCFYLQLLVGGFISYLRYLCMFGYSGVQHILCCIFCFVCFRPVSCVPKVTSVSGLFVFVLYLVYPRLPVSLDCPFGFL
jgi:hypothetical protein